MPWDYPPTYGPWHNWFAWHPVRTRQHGWRWLQPLERRQAHSLRNYWQYRPREGRS